MSQQVQNSLPFDDNRFYRLSELAGKPKEKPPVPGKIPAGASTIWLWVSQGLFPRPVKLGPRTTAWRGSDLNQWAESLTSNKAC